MECDRVEVITMELIALFREFIESEICIELSTFEDWKVLEGKVRECISRYTDLLDS